MLIVYNTTFRYDDSFDDLITMGADGVADAEGDDQLTVSQAIGRKYPETIREGSQRDDAQNPVMKGRNQKGKKHLGKKLWLLNGKIYNYHKEGAREVESQEEADQIIKTEDEVSLFCSTQTLSTFTLLDHPNPFTLKKPCTSCEILPDDIG